MSLPNISQYLPITVISAILLFVLKETIEFYKRRSAERRKIEAIKHLISIELQLNYWAVITIFRIFGEINKYLLSFPQAQFWLYTLPSGAESVRCSKDSDRECYISYSIPFIVDKQYKTLFLTIAELDEKLLRLLEKAYDELAELNHLRSSLIDYLKDDKNDKHHFFKSFIEYAMEHEKPCNETLKAAYHNCAGKELQEAKLRW